MSIANSSASLYNKIRALLPFIPSRNTVAAYNNTRDYRTVDGAAESDSTAWAQIMDRLDAILKAKKDTLKPWSYYGCLENDEVKTLQVCALQQQCNQAVETTLTL